MLQEDSTGSAETTPQTLADAAVAYLSPPAHEWGLSSSFPDAGPAPIAAAPSIDITRTYPLRHQDGNSIAATANESQIRSEIETDAQTPALPSLLQYIDHVLMRDTSRHNHPPHAGQTCMICNLQWDKASTPSTFLPLFPCDDWVHYRCLIWLATRDGPHKDRCYACNARLYDWDGISALTLATRTSLPLGESYRISLPAGAHAPSGTERLALDEFAYEHECALIEGTIARAFFAQLALPSPFSDGSPDLVRCYDGVVHELNLMRVPQSKWLMWSTSTGALLFSMLVAIKMRRFLVEGHGRIVLTEAWTAWEEACMALQRKILEDVHTVFRCRVAGRRQRS